MHSSKLLSLGLILLCLASCRARAPIPEEEKADEKSAVESATAVTMSPVESSPVLAETVSKKEAPMDVPIAMQPPTSAPQRVEQLSFAHGNGLCVQVNPGGDTSLQPCKADAAGQKFLFARSLDGRVQLKDASSQLCLSVGPIGFLVTVLRGEVCESKSRQFFSVVDYGTTYSLKFDANNTCIDAELSRVDPGTRLILFRCSAVLNQKIQLLKP